MLATDRRKQLALAAILAVVALLAFVALLPANRTLTVQLDGCLEGTGPGVAVVVRDSDGDLLATSSVETAGCRVAIDVPADQSAYAVSAGPLGEHTYSRDSLDEHGWSVRLTD